MERSNECPYCEAEMKFGYLVPFFDLYWGEGVSTLGQVKDNVIKLSGLGAPVNQLPSLHCKNCEVIISQYR